MKSSLSFLAALLLAPLAVTAVAAENATLQNSERTPPPENRRPENFQPFHYKQTTEQLMELFSADQVNRAEAEFQAIAKVNEQGPWKPTWESLDRHNPPEWFLDAKLGIMLNWGLHSVPASDLNKTTVSRPAARFRPTGVIGFPIGGRGTCNPENNW